MVTLLVDFSCVLVVYLCQGCNIILQNAAMNVPWVLNLDWLEDVIEHV